MPLSVEVTCSLDWPDKTLFYTLAGRKTERYLLEEIKVTVYVYYIYTYIYIYLKKKMYIKKTLLFQNKNLVLRLYVLDWAEKARHQKHRHTNRHVDSMADPTQRDVSEKTQKSGTDTQTDIATWRLNWPSVPLQWKWMDHSWNIRANWGESTPLELVCQGNKVHLVGPSYLMFCLSLLWKLFLV